MVLEEHVKGYDEFNASAEKHKGKTIFALFCGDVDETGKSWCPQCVEAEPVIMKNISCAPDDAVFIHCSVGQRDFWKDQKNVFRTDPVLKLKGVPTLLKYKAPQRLVEEECFLDDLVQEVFES